jgi:3'-phosphoadenosine 5'-phosphosulfate (PAPS) 3'-phosphatase
MYCADDLTVWVDPLDGTASFVKKEFDAVTTLIGIAYRGQALAGIISRPFPDCYKKVTAASNNNNDGFDRRCMMVGVVGKGAFYCQYGIGERIKSNGDKSRKYFSKMIANEIKKEKMDQQCSSSLVITTSTWRKSNVVMK